MVKFGVGMRIWAVLSSWRYRLSAGGCCAGGLQSDRGILDPKPFEEFSSHVQSRQRFSWGRRKLPRGTP